MSKKRICSIVIDTEKYVDGLETTLKSIFNQKLKGNEVISIFVDPRFIDNSLERNNSVEVYSIDDFSNKAFLSEWITVCKPGQVYSLKYFSKTYDYLKNSIRVFVTPMLDSDGKNAYSSFFAGKGKKIDCTKNNYECIDDYDAIWIPRKYYNTPLFKADKLTVAWRLQILYTIINTNTYEIIGNNISVCSIKSPYSKEEVVPSFETVEQVYLKAINYSLSKHGFVGCYIQKLLTDLFRKCLWNRKNAKNIITCNNEDFEKYRELVLYVLSFISLDVIKHDKKLSLEQKLFVLKQSGKEYRYVIENNRLFICDERSNYKKEYSPIIEYLFADIKKNTLKLESAVFLPYYSEDLNIQFGFKYNNMFYLGQKKNIDKPEQVLGEEVVAEKVYFDTNIPLTDNGNVECVIVIDGEEIVCSRYSYTRFFPISAKNSRQFYYKNGWTVKADFAKLVLSNKYSYEELEDNYCKDLNSLDSYLRSYSSYEKEKPVWLIWDRPTAGGDNGEALFKYMCDNVSEVDFYFVINEDADDYVNLKESYKEKIVETGSIRHKMLFVLADVLIGSQTDSVMWPVDGEIYRDIIANKPFVFLQHGITKNDMSPNYSKFYQNIRLFVTAGVSEYENTKNNPNYGFSDNMVQLVGFPRFDLLENKKSKYIAVLPTWRKYCVTKDINGNDCIIEDFKETRYFDFYSNLLSNKKLLDRCKKNGYKILLMQHNLFKETDKYFEKSDVIEIADESWTYRRVISEASILVTDYSSVSFDFAYLNKHLIYCQFDEDLFYKTHTYQQGFFDYCRDGFGPVVYKVENAVEEILKAMRENSIEKKYLNRINSFFGYRDKENCKRVYEAIKEIR